MRKLFLKYFFSILAITLISLFIQNGFLILQYTQSQTKWKDFVYVDFVDNVEKSLSESSFPNFHIDSMTIFKDALEADSRVSGFLVKDQAGRISFTVEQTADGKIITSPATENMMANRSKKIASDSHNTVLNIHYNGSSFTIDRTQINQSKTTYIPQDISANDLIGTVSIMFESQLLSTIDILGFSPRTYKYSKDIINSCIRSITITIPICIVISVVLSWIISSINAKYIDSIRKALNDLSKGKHNVKLKKNKNNELNEITVAVEDLDSTLQANEKSRQAWLTSISHDLNTPATAMKMVVDGLNDGIFKPTKATLQDLQKENDTLCSRISKVIEFSTLQADVKPVFETVRTEELLSSITVAYPELKTSTETEQITCDKSLIAKAITELLNNAYALSRDVSLTIKKANKSFTVEVSNPGNFPQTEDYQQFFEPWTKGDKSRSTSGNGLGLPIVGTIAKLHNGEAKISEKDGIVTVSVSWAL